MLKTEERCDDGRDAMIRTQAAITVKPLFRQGHEIVCSIDAGGYMQGGNIELPKGHYSLTFNLLEGNPAGLNFEPNDVHGDCEAFWSESNDCPRNSTNHAGYSARLSDPRTLTVDVDVDPGAPPEAVHYRLNFDNHCYFDPIIIHE